MQTDIKNFFSQGPLPVIKKIFLFSLALSFVYRLIFFYFFANASVFNSSTDFLYSLYLSLKFDIRFAVLTATPFFLLWPIFCRIKKSLCSLVWIILYNIFYLLLFVIFILDIGHFDYLGARLSFSSMRLLENFYTSFKVAMDYYPVSVIALCLIIFFIGLNYILKNIFYINKTISTKKINKIQSFVLYFGVSFVMALGIYGKLAPPPALRWSDTYVLKNTFLIKASLNPLLYFYDSSLWNSVSYDLNAVKKIYPHIKKVLGIVNHKNSLSFDRIIKGRAQGSLNAKTNVIVIIMESLVKHRTSLMNPMNATPYLKEIAKNGIYFSNFYTSTMGTARGVFSTLTSVPDPNFGRKGTASRNNDLPEQNSALNALTNHNKFYFLGGSLNWAQMRGVIRRAIPDITLFEEGSYTSPNTDVWGLSDLDLVIEADKVFKNQDKPFAAVLQFASFHSPFTIPKDKKSFKLEQQSLRVLKRNGFKHLKEYNSLRFSDYSLNYLMQLAKKHKYFNNTLFVILGDHGGAIRGTASQVPQHFKDFNLGFSMTPLIFYAPKKLKPNVYNRLALQVDILPSAVAALGQTFVATGFGINLFNSFLKREYAFMQNGAEMTLLYTDKVIKYNIQADKIIKRARLNPYRLQKVNHFAHADYVKNQIKNLHETIKYMLLHNKNKNKSN